MAQTAPLIYKMRIKNPNERGTPSANKSYIKYIAERDHVLKKDASMQNGLFGKIDGVYSTDMKTEDVQKKVYDLSRKGVTMYKAYISFKDFTAKHLELNNFEDWERYVRYHLDTIMRGYGIPADRFEYTAAIHKKWGQPHIHLVFWDKQQGVTVNFVKKGVSDDIRRKLIHDTFKNELAFYYDRSSTAFADVKTDINKLINEMQGISDSEIPEEVISDLAKTYNDILNDLPKSGRLAYAFMPKEIKDRIGAFIREISDKLPEVKSLISEYYLGNRLAAQMFDSSDTEEGKRNIDKKIRKATADLYNRLGNQIIKSMAKIRKEMQKRTQEEKQTETDTAGTVLSLVSAITRMMKDSNSHLPKGEENTVGSHDLSASALKDLIAKKKDKGHEA